MWRGKSASALSLRDRPVAASTLAPLLLAAGARCKEIPYPVVVVIFGWLIIDRSSTTFHDTSWVSRHTGKPKLIIRKKRNLD